MRELDKKLNYAQEQGELKAREFGFTSFPIDPFEIAKKVEIIVQPKLQTKRGVSGMLLRNGNNFGIFYATNIPNKGFQRFSVGHELGHYFLPGHAEAVLVDGIHTSRGSFMSNNSYEMEADQFSVGLLMPKKLFVSALCRAGIGISAIKSLANLCQTSLTSTAIRFVQCAEDPMAIIISNGNNVDYCCMSNAMKEIKGISWIKRNQKIPRNSATFSFNQDKQKIQIESYCNFQDWFSGKIDLEINEDVIRLGNDYGKTLTILYGINIPEQYEESDSDLIESWTPRF